MGILSRIGAGVGVQGVMLTALFGLAAGYLIGKGTGKGIGSKMGLGKGGTLKS